MRPAALPLAVLALLAPLAALGAPAAAPTAPPVQRLIRRTDQPANVSLDSDSDSNVQRGIVMPVKCAEVCSRSMRYYS